MISIEQEILGVSEASEILRVEIVQTLWSGYGHIKRFYLKEGKLPTVIVKQVTPPHETNHPKGWNSGLSHQRKLKSYQVEASWYEKWAHLTHDHCRVPELYYSGVYEQGIVLIMEDLDHSGYPVRVHHDNVTIDQMKSCLAWLAHFHARFMREVPEGLWTVGTYWHLETRTDEWTVMPNSKLKEVAHLIDQHLNQARFKTFVHGDAKLANFCFSEETGEVSAVDFQYVGGGCGMKDVVYFMSSCLYEEDCKKYEGSLLKYYFKQLEVALDSSFFPVDFKLVMNEWSRLYRYAWADFYRFLDGWSPGHWKMHEYSKGLTESVIQEIKRKEDEA